MGVPKGQADSNSMLCSHSDTAVYVANIPLEQILYFVFIRRLPLNLYDIDTGVEFKGILNLFKISSKFVRAGNHDLPIKVDDYC